MKNGVDLSHDNDVMSWKTMVAAGISFVFVKATEGITVIDPLFKVRQMLAKLLVIEFNAYHFYIPTDDGAAQAEHFLSVAGTVKKMALDLEPALVNGSDSWLAIPEQQRYTQLRAFLARIEAAGIAIVIYGTKDFIESLLPQADFLSQYELWAVCYEPELKALPKFWTTWAYWQHRQGSVAGVSGIVDLDFKNE